MLDSLTPEQFDEWIAYRREEPDPYERLITVIKLGFCAVCASNGIEVSPSQLDPKPEHEEVVGPQQAAMFISQALGKPDGDRNR